MSAPKEPIKLVTAEEPQGLEVEVQALMPDRRGECLILAGAAMATTGLVVAHMTDTSAYTITLFSAGVLAFLSGMGWKDRR